MALKALVIAGVAALALAGCALFLASSDSHVQTPKSCLGVSCNVSVKQPWPFGDLDVPDEIAIDPKNTKNITWTLDGWKWTHFNPESKQGIVFNVKDDGTKYFACDIAPTEKDKEKPRAYLCTIEGAPAGKHKYKYTIRTKGFGSPPDKDPWVVSQ